MVKINLLPHRQERRKEQREAFFAMCGAAAVLAVVLMLLWNHEVSAQLELQNERNAYIDTETAKLDASIKAIDEMHKRKEDLLQRMKVIQDLQGRRPVIVRIFDELVRVMPNGVYLTSLDRHQDNFHIKGVAENTNEISSLMRNISASPWFKNPQLHNVVASSAKNGSSSNAGTDAAAPENFDLDFSLQIPKTVGADGGAGATGKSKGRDTP